MVQKRQTNIKGIALFLVGTVMLISFAFYAFQIVYSPNVLIEKDSRIVIIPEGADFKQVQDIMYDGRYVNDMVSFSFLSKLMKYDENIKPGRYLLEANMTNVAAIRMLRAGERTPISITFNNIRLIDELAPKITSRLNISAEEFQAQLAQYAQSQDEFSNETLISMFIPNTYEVYFTTSAESLIERMKREYDSFWTEERRSKAEKLGLTPQEVSTLASIVQAETSKK